MSKDYEGQNPLDIAARAEKDMNSFSNRTGAGKSSDSGKFAQSFYNSTIPFEPCSHTLVEVSASESKDMRKRKESLISQMQVSNLVSMKPVPKNFQEAVWLTVLLQVVKAITEIFLRVRVGASMLRDGRFFFFIMARSGRLVELQDPFLSNTNLTCTFANGLNQSNEGKRFRGWRRARRQAAPIWRGQPWKWRYLE
jgi:hypothetical protein